jgi:hypothetical protein
MRHLDLFSGIGGFALSASWVWGEDHEIVSFCEIDKYCQKVLKKHWPGVPIIEDIKCLKSILLQQGFHAKILASLGRVPAYPDAVLDSGGRWCHPFAWYDQTTSSWRTWQRCLVGGWEKFKGTWPTSGMTRNGIAYQRVPLVPHNKEKEYLSLPTITANEGKGAGRKRYRGSKHFRGAKMSEGLRTCQTDPIYTHPNFAESVMGYEKDWTL